MSLATQLALFTDTGLTVNAAMNLTEAVQDTRMPGLHRSLSFQAPLVGRWVRVHKNVLQFDGSASATAPVALSQIVAVGNSEPLVVAGCGSQAQFREVYAADGGTDAVIQVIGLDPNGAIQLLRTKNGTTDAALVRANGSPDLQDATTATEYYTCPSAAQTYDLCGVMAIIVAVKTIASEAGTIECKVF